jgi:hypothetical protein
VLGFRVQLGILRLKIAHLLPLFGGLSVIDEMFDFDPLGQFLQSADMIHMVMGEDQVIDPLHAGRVDRLHDAVGVPSARIACVFKQRFSGGRYVKNGVAPFGIDDVHVERLGGRLRASRDREHNQAEHNEMRLPHHGDAITWERRCGCGLRSVIRVALDRTLAVIGNGARTPLLREIGGDGVSSHAAGAVRMHERHLALRSRPGFHTAGATGMQRSLTSPETATARIPAGRGANSATRGRSTAIRNRRN